MRLFLSQPSSLAYVCLLIGSAMLPSHAAAQTVQTDEYIYIGVEAEDHDAKEDRWVTTTPTTATTEDDPDGNHSDQAGGSTYLELLPDVRVTHEDDFGPPLAYWEFGGDGPQADYQVDFPEPGRYYVHVRAYSTGTEDNGMHVGINETWPASGLRMQFCIAQYRAWRWASAQRDAGGNGSCGMEKTIWLDVPTAGVHTVNISAREDGFEIDRFALIKDLSGNTRVCEPASISDVECKDGSIESADEFVDMRVLLSAVTVGADPDVEPANPTEVAAGDSIIMTARVENLDSFDTANDIVMTLSPVPGEWNITAMDSRCESVGDDINCSLASQHPTAPNEFEQFDFTMQALVEGLIRIDASILSSDMDDAPDNDVTATVINVLSGDLPEPEESDIMLRLNTNSDSYDTGESLALSVVLANVGDYGDDVLFSLQVPSGLSLDTQSLPNECSFTTQVECDFAGLAANASEVFEINLVADVAGVYSLRGDVVAPLDVNSANDSDSHAILVSDAIVVDTSEETSTSGSTDETDSGSSGETDNGSSQSGTTDAGNDSDVEESTSTGETGTDSSEEDTITVVIEDPDAGSLTHWLVLVLMMVCLTRLYGWHQSKLVPIRK